MNDEKACVGNIYDGVDRNNYYFKWVDPNLPEKCNKCKFLPLCQGGCRAGQLGYLSVFCKRNKPTDIEKKLMVTEGGRIN